MNTLALPAALALSIGVIAQPGAGQSLEERVDAIRQKRADRQQRSPARILQVLLYKRVSADFDRAPARDVFEYLATVLGVQVVVRYSDDPVGFGIDPELPVTVSVRDEFALETLQQVLEEVSTVESCTWQIRNDALEIGTKERLSGSAMRETRWYPVDELLFEAPDFDNAIDMRLEAAFPTYGGYAGGANPGLYGPGGPGGSGGSGGYGGSIRYSTGTPAPAREANAESLIELITNVVEPTAWRRNGGEWASIFYRDGTLIVHAPPYIHRRIFGYPKVPPPAAAEASETETAQ